MPLSLHLFAFIAAGVVTWLAAGRLIEGVDRLARRLRQTGFTVAFFVLGFMTSMGELSVMVNSTLAGEPQVSAGNLAGASIALMLFLVPLTAILANGIRLDYTMNRPQLAVALIAAALPAILMVDGDATWYEGLLCVAAYTFLALQVRSTGTQSRMEELEEMLEEVIEESYEEADEEEEEDEDREEPDDEDDAPVPLVLAHVVVNGVLIFVAGNFLVDESVYFSERLNVGSALIGLLVLSVGTNIPEITISIRSALHGRTHVAFGNYVGSALTNSLFFGLMALAVGSFPVEQSTFIITAAVTAAGFAAFFLAASTHSRISRLEGILLVLLFAGFLVSQVANAVRLPAE